MDTGVLLRRVRRHLLVVSQMPVQDPSHEGRDERDTGLSASHGLSHGEEQGEIAVDALLLLQVASGLDAFPSRAQFDEDSVARDAVASGASVANQVAAIEVPAIHHGRLRPAMKYSSS